MTEKQLKLTFTVWRLINWLLVSFLVIRAVFALTWLLPGDPQAAVRWIASIAIIAYAMVNVFVWAHQTDKDDQRMNSGVRLTLLATVIIVACRVLRYIFVLLNILLVPANFWSVMIWYPMLAGILYVSITKEKQMTDKKMSKVRTPPKRKHTQGTFMGQPIDVEEWNG